MSKKQLVIEFASIDGLEEEFEKNLQHGGTFAQGASDFEQTEQCEVVLVHPEGGAKITLAAEVVMVVPEGAGQGVGIALKGFDGASRERLSAFVKEQLPPKRESVPIRHSSQPPKSVHERLRGLSTNEQQKMARSYNLNERVLLERIYGKAVWEPILRNTRVTIPEVARIARMAALPRPLLELIASNASWLTAPHVRRSLLSNSRMTGEMVMKVLRLIPKNELRLVHKQTTYSAAVRNAARKLLG